MCGGGGKKNPKEITVTLQYGVNKRQAASHYFNSCPHTVQILVLLLLSWQNAPDAAEPFYTEIEMDRIQDATSDW